MRLWHHALIPYLPRQQLLSQWRECVCIAKSLAEKGTPNHVLVNKILEYSSVDFLVYGEFVMREFRYRGYQMKDESMRKFYGYNREWRERRKVELNGTLPKYAESMGLFEFWHTPSYLRQCYYNLQEKHDCGAVPDDEWERFEQGYMATLKGMEKVLEEDA